MRTLTKAMLICGFAIGVVLFSFPKLVTGHYADITIKSVSVDPNGQYRLEFTMVSSCGTPVSEEFYQDDRYLGGGSGSGGTFPRRPSPGGSGVAFMLRRAEKALEQLESRAA